MLIRRVFRRSPDSRALVLKPYVSGSAEYKLVALRSRSRVSRVIFSLLAITIIQALIANSLGSSISEAAHFDITPKAPAYDSVALDESRPSIVLASDGTVIGRFRSSTFHDPLSYAEIPEVVVLALLAAEDRSFFTHEGYDTAAIARAAVANFESGSVVQGGSTITQQLVKTFFTDGDRSLDRKVNELLLSMAVEEEWTKEQILTAYLNTVYLGESTFGVEAASQSYFRKPAADLTISEAALLMGVIPAPSVYSPRSNAELAEQNRVRVIRDMVEADFITEAEALAAELDIPRIYNLPPRFEAYPFYVDYVRTYLLEVEKLDPSVLFSGGLVIETPLVPSLQDQAYAAIETYLPGPEDPSSASTVIDPFTGYVQALVSSDDWSSSQVNLATGELSGGLGRQPGSSFKPFVLAAALEQGASLNDIYSAPANYTPVGAQKPVWNYDQRARGNITLAEAMRLSVNTTYVQLTEQVTPDSVASMASRLGLTTFPEDSYYGPSIGIGAYESSTLDMATAYGVFTTSGFEVQPTPIVRITNSEGEVVIDNTNRSVGERVIDSDVADQVTSALTSVVKRGTGTRARITGPAAGKTGTTDDYQNAWFVGYTPCTVMAVWVGFPEGNIPMRNVAGYRSVSGGTIPAAIWHDTMQPWWNSDANCENSPRTEFPRAPEPPEKVSRPLPTTASTQAPEPTSAPTSTTPEPTVPLSTDPPGSTVSLTTTKPVKTVPTTMKPIKTVPTTTKPPKKVTTTKPPTTVATTKPPTTVATTKPPTTVTTTVVTTPTTTASTTTLPVETTP